MSSRMFIAYEAIQSISGKEISYSCQWLGKSIIKCAENAMLWPQDREGGRERENALKQY